MNLISIILSFLIFGITLVPCKDTLSGHQHYETENRSHDSGDDHEGQENCPPLCSCECCGASIDLPSSALAEKDLVQKINSHSYHYSFSYGYDYTKGIWHPPTIC